MAIQSGTTHFVDDISATAQTAVAGASDFKRHQFHFDSTGTWSVVIEMSPDGGTTWVECSEALSLSSDTGSIYLVGAFADLRANMTRTSGDLDGWVVQTDSHPLRW